MGVASNRVDIKQAAAVAERTLERLAEPLSALFLPADQLARQPARRSLARGHPQQRPRLDLRLLGGRGVRRRRPPLRRGHPDRRGPHRASARCPRARPSASTGGCRSSSTPRLVPAAAWWRCASRARRARRLPARVGAPARAGADGPHRRRGGHDHGRRARVRAATSLSFSIDDADGTELIHVEREPAGTLVTPVVRRDLADLRASRAGELMRSGSRTGPAVTVLAHVADVAGYGWQAWTGSSSASEPVTVDSALAFFGVIGVQPRKSANSGTSVSGAESFARPHSQCRRREEPVFQPACRRATA